MKTMIALFFASALLLPAETPAWKPAAEILTRITPPQFPAREIDITRFGAEPNTDASPTILRAVAECAAAGGGRVVIPAGEFFTGPIHLKSNVELHLATNAVLKFVTEPARYLPAVFTRFEGTECYNLSPLIYANGQTNIAVTGTGTLDGQADDSNWLAWGKSSTRKQLARLAEENVPVAQRQFGVANHLRPDFIEFNRCQNVLIAGIKIRRSPMWEIHPLLCTNVIVRDVDISSHGANNDGCDPESCRDVLIENCIFDTGDDCIAIKSGRNADGRRVDVPAQDIVIRDCTMRDGHGGVTIGSEISGSCRNVFVENCEMDSPKLNCVLRLKSNAMRGGVLEIDFLYEEGAAGNFPPVARNIVMENITVAQTPRVLNVRGFPAAEIRNVRIFRSRFQQVKKPDVVQNADVKLVDCQIEAAK